MVGGSATDFDTYGVNLLVRLEIITWVVLLSRGLVVSLGTQ